VRLALEHGGTATAIVDASARLEHTLRSVTRGAFYHAGQVCVSTQIVLVHASIYDSFCTALAKKATQLKVGDPSDELTDVGPLISKKDVQRVHKAVQAAVAEGAQLLCGGELLPGNCYAPTVLRDTDQNMEVRSKEIFGPVVCLEQYSDLSEAFGRVNCSPFSFQAAIYTENINQTLAAARAIETKALIVNDSTAFRVDWMPFGGEKSSGLGVGGTRDAVREMTTEKLVVFRQLTES
jgi:acyl-CoA reductase-like NAD-dependent aldehyde dehydrogenase